LRPTPEVANTLKRWFGCVRYTYNWALGCIKAKPKQYKLNMIWLRKRFINVCNIPKDKKFLLDTPKSIRDNAVSDLQDAFKSNFAIKKKNPTHTFDIKFRKKKDAQAITITSEQIKHWDTDKTEFSMFPTFLKNKIKFHVNKNKSVPSKVSYDCKLLMSRLGKFSLVIVFHDPPCENQTGKSRSCSIDPGVRTALTIYCPEPGICYKIGDGDISRIYRLCLWLDKLISSQQNENTRGKRLAILRLRERIRNLVTEFHCKAVHFLLSKFNVIILPPFNVSQMVKRADRKISTKTVRQMLSWRHYGLRQRLLNAAKMYNATIYIRGEEYTSKICTHCRHCKHNLGGAKIYKCTECKLKADRDCCGARNIFIKNMKTT
jgi:putative transposase